MMEDSVRQRQVVRLPTNTERVQRARPQEGYICEDYDPVEEIKKMVDTYSEEKKKRVCWFPSLFKEWHNVSFEVTS